MHGLALLAALVHRRPGPCNARDALGAHGSRRENVTSTRKTHRTIYSFSVEKNHICEMTARYFLGERRESQLCACLSVFASCVLVFGVTLFLVIILGQKSPVAVQASLVELSLKTRMSVATSSLLCLFEAQVYDGSLPASMSSAALFRGELCCILTQDTFLSRDEFVVVMQQTP